MKQELLKIKYQFQTLNLNVGAEKPVPNDAIRENLCVILNHRKGYSENLTIIRKEGSSVSSSSVGLSFIIFMLGERFIHICMGHRASPLVIPLDCSTMKLHG